MVEVTDATPIQPLAWEPPYAADAALKRPKNKQTNKPKWQNGGAGAPNVLKQQMSSSGDLETHDDLPRGIQRTVGTGPLSSPPGQAQVGGSPSPYTGSRGSLHPQDASPCIPGMPPGPLSPWTWTMGTPRMRDSFCIRTASAVHLLCGPRTLPCLVTPRPRARGWPCLAGSVLTTSLSPVGSVGLGPRLQLGLCPHFHRDGAKSTCDPPVRLCQVLLPSATSTLQIQVQGHRREARGSGLSELQNVLLSLFLPPPL